MKYLTCGIIALAILSVIFAGCIGQKQASPATVTTSAPAVAPASPISSAPPSQLAGNWQLTRMTIQEGTALTYPTAEITLAFGYNGSVSGNGGCNNYFGSYTLNGVTTPKGDGITIGPLGSTKMYCTTTSKQESDYLELLQQTAAYNVIDTKLTLTSESQNVLTFQRPSSIPTQTMGMLPA